MAEGGAAKYQKLEEDSEETEDTEDSDSSTTDTSSDSMDLHDRELEISAAPDYNEDLEKCEVYSNHNIGCNDSIEECEDVINSGSKCMKNIELSEAFLEKESHCSKNFEQSEVYPNLQTESNAANLSQDLSNTDDNKLENAFPHKMIHRKLSKHRTGEVKIVGFDAAVYMAAVIEYMAREVLDLAFSCAQISERTRIKPRDLATAIQCDHDMGQLFNELKMQSEDSKVIMK